MSHQPFVIERTYNAPVARVWEAITSKEAMKQWYFDIAEFKPEVGFEFSFTGQDSECESYVHLCKIIEVEPLKKLKHTWTYQGYEGTTWVTFELFAEGEKTKLRLTHEGLENLPKIPAFAKENFQMGWTEIIGTLLPDFVEDDIIEMSVTTTAIAEKVWELFTRTEYIRQWGAAFMEGTYAESDFVKGAELVWKMPDGEVMVRGVITELQPQRLLEVTYYNDPSHTAPELLGKYQERYMINGQEIAIYSGPLPRTYTKKHRPMWEKALEIIRNLAQG